MVVDTVEFFDHSTFLRSPNRHHHPTDWYLGCDGYPSGVVAQGKWDTGSTSHPCQSLTGSELAQEAWIEDGLVVHVHDLHGHVHSLDCIWSDRTKLHRSFLWMTGRRTTRSDVAILISS